MTMQLPQTPYVDTQQPRCTERSDAPMWDFGIAGATAAAFLVAYVVNSQNPKMAAEAPAALGGLAISGGFVISGVIGTQSLSTCHARSVKWREREKSEMDKALKAAKLPFTIQLRNAYSESIFTIDAQTEATGEHFGPSTVRIPAMGETGPTSVYARVGIPMQVHVVVTSMGEDHSFDLTEVDPVPGTHLTLTYSWDSALAKFRLTEAWH